MTLFKPTQLPGEREQTIAYLCYANSENALNLIMSAIWLSFVENNVISHFI